MKEKVILIRSLAILLLISFVLNISKLIANFESVYNHIVYIYPIQQKLIIICGLLIEFGSLIASVCILRLMDLGRKLIVILAVMYIVNYVGGLILFSSIFDIKISKIVLDISFACVYIAVFMNNKIKAVFQNKSLGKSLGTRT